MLQAISLTKQYPAAARPSLDQLSLNVGAGDIFCLLGQNGAGKTTTINLFLGFLQPTSGQALLGGIDIAREPLEARRLLAYLPETVMLYPNLSGLENLDFFARLAGFRLTTDELRNLLGRAGLQPDAHQRQLGGYSKGMRQKVGIAIALAKQAKVLLLDEPTSGLDPKASNEFSGLLTQLSQSGTAILMATHDIFRAREVGTHIGIMREGKLVQTLAANDLTANELEATYLQTV